MQSALFRRVGALIDSSFFILSFPYSLVICLFFDFPRVPERPFALQICSLPTTAYSLFLAFPSLYSARAQFLCSAWGFFDGAGEMPGFFRWRFYREERQLYSFLDPDGLLHDLICIFFLPLLSAVPLRPGLFLGNSSLSVKIRQSSEPPHPFFPDSPFVHRAPSFLRI